MGDPQCIKNPDKFWEAGRDPERTPMQWDGSAQAGFSNSSDTWLPVHPNYKRVNAALQAKDAASPLSTMKRVLSWRKQHPELALGKIVAVPVASSLPSDIQDSLFVVESELLSGECAVTVGNLDPKRTVHFSLEAIRAGEPAADSWQLVVATQSDPRPIAANNVTLLPAEVGLLVAASKVALV